MSATAKHTDAMPELLKSAQECEIKLDQAATLLAELAEERGDVWARDLAEQLTYAAMNARAAIAKAEGR